MLVEGLAVGGHVDDVVVVSLLLEIFYAVEDGFGFEYHSWCASVGFIVDVFVFALAVGVEVMEVDGDFFSFLCSF